jgi:hypothetical protein
LNAGQFLPFAQRGPGRKLRAAASTNMAIPIVDAQRRIIGWSGITPELRGATLFQPEAERILGTPIVAMYVRIEDPEDARRAGAPPGWQGGWRCLALCSERMARNGAGDPVLLVTRSRRDGGQ